MPNIITSSPLSSRAHFRRSIIRAAEFYSQGNTRRIGFTRCEYARVHVCVHIGVYKSWNVFRIARRVKFQTECTLHDCVPPVINFLIKRACDYSCPEYWQQTNCFLSTGVSDNISLMLLDTGGTRQRVGLTRIIYCFPFVDAIALSAIYSTSRLQGRRQGASFLKMDR